MDDLMYFGYTYDEDNRGFEIEFKKDIAEKFPTVVLEDAYDDIKGYRQSVHFGDEYYCWLIANGWLEMSLNLQLMMMSEDQKEEFERIFELTRENYPEAFKPQK